MLINKESAHQNNMRKDAGVDSDAQRIGKLTWRLFLKVFNEFERDWEKTALEQGHSYICPKRNASAGVQAAYHCAFA